MVHLIYLYVSVPFLTRYFVLQTLLTVMEYMRRGSKNDESFLRWILCFSTEERHVTFQWISYLHKVALPNYDLVLNFLHNMWLQFIA